MIREVNVVRKDWRRVDVHVALCYPNIYRVGMTGLTVQLLYSLFNSREDVLCERFFLPTRGEGLLSLESRQPLKRFDVLAFSLQYEEDYFNFMRMLIEAGLPPRALDRGPDDPLIIAGGPCCVENPKVLADYIDLFIIGEAEPVLNKFIDRFKELRKPRRGVEDFADIAGVYVPTVPDVKVRRVWVKSLDDAPHPTAEVMPVVDEGSLFMPIFGRCFSIEVARSCGRGCRFCLIGWIGRPRRERSLGKVEDIVDEGLRYCGVRKVSLIGASVSDHSKIEDVYEALVSRGLEVSTTSLHVKSLTERLVSLMVKGGQRTVALAPEAATPRLRNVINKGVDEEEIIDAARMIVDGGIEGLKLYFMIGLPKEGEEDIEEVPRLVRRIVKLGFKHVKLTINPFIPKPHTPFQWEPLAPVSYVRSCLRKIKGGLKGLRVEVEGLDPRHAQVQTLLSRGGKDVGRVVELAASYGGGLGAWRRALRECKIDLEAEVHHRLAVDRKLPWSFIDIGVNIEYLAKEYEKSLLGSSTPPCEVECLKCGVCGEI